MIQHAFHPCGNPRLATRCACGQPMEAHAPQVGGRDPAFERDFIGLARRRAGGHESWEADVHDRMQRMEREKGTESYLAFTLRQIVNEADCEGLDLGGWPMLGALLAVRDLKDSETRQIFQELMCQLATLGAQTRAVCDQARELLA